MKTYFGWTISFLYFTVAAVCSAGSFTPVPLNCSMFDSTLVATPDKRMEVSVSGFSILPPQGENWCVKSLASRGLSFLKAPLSIDVFGRPTSPEELAPTALRAVRFSGLAVSFPDFGFNIESADQVKIAVDKMISTHIFSQFTAGISTAERRYQLIESHSAVDRSLVASCVRFDAKVEARGLRWQLPGTVVVLAFINNLVCAHPQPVSSQDRLIWISFVEAYREGEKSAADTARREVQPFLQSLQFMPRR